MWMGEDDARPLCLVPKRSTGRKEASLATDPCKGVIAPETGVGGRPESDGAAAGTRITVLKTPVEGVTNRHERDEQRGARRRSNRRH
ncbi:unnamed protein product [Gadus morhua 'NCC']